MNDGTVFARSRSEEDSLTRLLKGEVDYTLMDDLVIQHIVSNYPEESRTRLQIGSAPLLTRELYFAVRRTRPGVEALIARFNAQLRGMITDRTYHRLLHVDWIRADVNGDGVAGDVPYNDRPGPSAATRLLTLHDDRDGVEDDAEDRFLRRREHLQRLGERAGELQRGEPEVSGSEKSIGQHLQVHPVICSPRSRIGAEGNEGVEASANECRVFKSSKETSSHSMSMRSSMRLTSACSWWWR